MKKIDLGRTINTLANVGVIAGLAFVGMQLLQDRKMAEVSTLYEATNIRMYWTELVRESPETWTKGLAGDPLLPAESEVFDLMAGTWELFHYTASVAQSVVGLNSERFVREWALHLYENPGLLEWWEAYKRRYSYADPPAPGESNPWFDAIDAEMRVLQASPPTFD